MLTVKTQVYSDRINFHLHFKPSPASLPEHPVPAESLYLSYNAIKDSVKVSRLHNPENMDYSQNALIIDKEFPLLIGMVCFLGKKYFVLAQETRQVSVFKFGEVFRVERVFLIDVKGLREVSEELLMLQEFFDSYIGKLFYYVPYDFGALVGSCLGVLRVFLVIRC